MKPRYEKNDPSWLYFSEVYVMLLGYLIYFWRPNWIFRYIVWENHVLNTRSICVIYLSLMLLNHFLYGWLVKKSTIWTVLLGSLAPAGVILTLRQIAAAQYWFLFPFIIGIGLFVVTCWQYQAIKSRFSFRKARYIWNKAKRRMAFNLYLVLIISGFLSLKTLSIFNEWLPAIETAVPGQIWNHNQDYLRCWKTGSFSTLSIEERIELCEKLIEIECMYHDLEPISFIVEEYSKKTQLGYYSQQRRVISISSKVLTGGRMRLLDTLLHEFHHAYAYSLVESESNSSEEALLYAEGFRTYEEDHKNWSTYYNNPVEVAARAYSSSWTFAYLDYIDSI